MRCDVWVLDKKEIRERRCKRDAAITVHGEAMCGQHARSEIKRLRRMIQAMIDALE